MKNHEKILTDFFVEQLENIICRYKSRSIPENFRRECDAMPSCLEPASSFLFPYPRLVLGYYLPASPHYHDPKILTYAKETLEHFTEYIHDDGTTDLPVTNFHDPAQNSFYVIRYLAVPTALLCHLSEHTEAEDSLLALHRDVLLKLGNAMATLGFHTPNHRWLISAALAVADTALGEDRFRDVIDRFLMEGIDCDENGEYTERSTGSYNIVCDRAFINLAFFLNDPSFLDYPRRNLNLMLHFIEPDFTVNTLNSSRWDQGGRYSIAGYYAFYLMLALIDRNPEFAYLADRISDRFTPYDCAPPSDIELPAFFLLYPEIAKRWDSIESQPISADQTIFLPKSHIARIYMPDLNATTTLVCTRHPAFLQMNIGSFILQARYASSFFGDPHSQFRPTVIEPTEDGYRLISEESAGYRSQLDEAPETSDWRRMDHSKRHILNVQTLRRTVTVHLKKDGFALDLDAEGCENVPTKFEFVLNPGYKLDNENFATIAKPGDYIFLRGGTTRYFIGDGKYLEFDGCFASHTYGEQMRGAFPDATDKLTLAMTTVTPHHSHIEMHVKPVLEPVPEEE